MATALRVQAEQVTDHMATTMPTVLGVCLYGSVARGDDDVGSDIDLLVVGTDRSLTPSRLRRQLPLGVHHDTVSFAYHTPDTLDRYFEKWPRFMAHVRQEGQILLDREGTLRRALERVIPLSTKAELAAQVAHLENYDHLERFGGNFLFPLAHLARVGRAVVFALLAERGILEFNRRAAFDRLAAECLRAAADLEQIRRLGPFHELVTGRSEQPLPFSPNGCPDEVATAREAIRRLIELSRHADELTGRT